MLIAHHVIDALRGLSDETLFLMDDKTCLATADMIDRAEKFQFGEIHLEPSKSKLEVYTPDQSEPITYDIPKLSNDERSWFADKLIPVPAPLCWYEFKLKTRSAVLVIDSEEEIACIRFDYFDGHPSGVGIKVSCKYAKIARDENTSQEVIIDANDIARKFLKEHPEIAASEGAMIELVFYLTLMLNSKTTERTREHAEEKLNKVRLKRGKTPLFDHTVVNITPVRFIDHSAHDGDSGRTSPRLHWRRSHLRTLHRGEPEEKKIVIPRFLVGKAELGEVTHEYVIKQGERK